MADLFTRYVRIGSREIELDSTVVKKIWHTTIHPSQRAWMVAYNLRPNLLDVGPRADFSVDGLALNPTEYKILPRNIDALAENARAVTLAAVDGQITDEDLKRADRAARHRLEAFEAPVKEHTIELRRRYNCISRLGNIAAGREIPAADETDESASMILSTTWVELLNMLDVVRIQRNWDDRKRTRAEVALEGVLLEESDGWRTNSWLEMIALAQEYTKARRLLFTDRSRKLGKFLLH